MNNLIGNLDHDLDSFALAGSLEGLVTVLDVESVGDQLLQWQFTRGSQFNGERVTVNEKENMVSHSARAK